jgi:transposase-like protein
MSVMEQEPARSRRSFPGDEFKRDAVALVIDEGRRVIDVARSLGGSLPGRPRGSRSRWRVRSQTCPAKRFMTGGHEPRPVPPPRGSRRPSWSR